MMKENTLKSILVNLEKKVKADKKSHIKNGKIQPKLKKTDLPKLKSKSNEVKANNSAIKGVEFPFTWRNLNESELKEKARTSVLALSKSIDENDKAKELGFESSGHLMEVCFDYLLKKY